MARADAEAGEAEHQEHEHRPDEDAAATASEGSDHVRSPAENRWCGVLREGREGGKGRAITEGRCRKIGPYIACTTQVHCRYRTSVRTAPSGKVNRGVAGWRPDTPTAMDKRP